MTTHHNAPEYRTPVVGVAGGGRCRSAKLVYPFDCYSEIYIKTRQIYAHNGPSLLTSSVLTIRNIHSLLEHTSFFPILFHSLYTLKLDRFFPYYVFTHLMHIGLVNSVLATLQRLCSERSGRRNSILGAERQCNSRYQ